MADKFMYVPNDDTQNYTFCRIKLLVLKCLDTQLYESKFDKSSQKVVKSTNRET